jgi:hypothetical protein
VTAEDFPPHECLPPVCRELVVHEQLFCGAHWGMLPQSFKNAVWATYKAAPGGQQHTAACLAARRYLLRTLGYAS